MIENIGSTTFQFIKSGSGHDMHFLSTQRVTEDDYKVEWHCWHFSKEFFDALRKHGLPPVHLDYDKLMEKLAKEKEQTVEIEE